MEFVFWGLKIYLTSKEILIVLAVCILLMLMAYLRLKYLNWALNKRWIDRYKHFTGTMVCRLVLWIIPVVLVLVVIVKILQKIGIFG